MGVAAANFSVCFYTGDWAEVLPSPPNLSRTLMHPSGLSEPTGDRISVLSSGFQFPWSRRRGGGRAEGLWASPTCHFTCPFACGERASCSGAPPCGRAAPALHVVQCV